MSLTKLIHVVEVHEGSVTSVKTFTEDRVTEAHDLFKSYARSNINKCFTDEECEEFINECCAELKFDNLDSHSYGVYLIGGELG